MKKTLIICFLVCITVLVFGKPINLYNKGVSKLNPMEAEIVAATVYQNANYKGASKVLYEGKFSYEGARYRLNNAADLNDAISSIKVQPNYIIKVWVDAVNKTNRAGDDEGEGAWILVDKDIPNLAALNMDDKISFIEIIKLPVFFQNNTCRGAFYNFIKPTFIPPKGKFNYMIGENLNLTFTMVNSNSVTAYGVITCQDGMLSDKNTLNFRGSLTLSDKTRSCGSEYFAFDPKISIEYFVEINVCTNIARIKIPVWNLDIQNLTLKSEAGLLYAFGGNHINVFAFSEYYHVVP
jgi:hypothetical protein